MAGARARRTRVPARFEVRVTTIGVMSVVAIGLSLGLLLGAPGPAGADHESGHGSTEAEAEGTSLIGRARVAGGRYRPTGCRYDPIEPTDLVTIDGVDHHAHGRRCPGRIADVVLVPVTPPSVGDLLPGAVEEARRRLPRPEPILEPVRPGGWVVVGVPVDVRLGPASLVPVVVTAAIDGPAPTWVTVRAVPAAVRFEPGEPDARAVVCSPGQAAAPYRPERPGPCAHTFVNASSVAVDGSFDARLSVVWAVDFASSDGPGTLPVEPTVTAFAVEVAEIQTVVTCVFDCGAGRWTTTTGSRSGSAGERG